MKHTGNLTITDQNLETCLVLAEVTGELSVLAKGAQFPKLVKAGALYVRAKGAQFPELAEVTGALSVEAEGAQFPALVKTGWLSVEAKGAQFPALGRVIAMSTWGLVLLNNGMFCAGCRGPWTREQALAHWGERTDERAELFTAAIRKLGEDA